MRRESPSSGWLKQPPLRTRTSRRARPTYIARTQGSHQQWVTDEDPLRCLPSSPLCSSPARCLDAHRDDATGGGGAGSSGGCDGGSTLLALVAPAPVRFRRRVGALFNVTAGAAEPLFLPCPCWLPSMLCNLLLCGGRRRSSGSSSQGQQQQQRWRLRHGQAWELGCQQQQSQGKLHCSGRGGAPYYQYHGRTRPRRGPWAIMGGFRPA
jgi:hypothetical protein